MFQMKIELEKAYPFMDKINNKIINYDNMLTITTEYINIYI